MKKSISIFSVFMFIITAIIFYFIAQVLYQDKEKSLISFLIEGTKISIHESVVSLNNSLNNSDDIGVLISVQMLSKNPQISSVFMLNKEKTSIAQNNMPEDLVENSDMYIKALNTQTELIQNISDKNKVLLSIPLYKENVLFCLISIKDALDKAKRWKMAYYGIAFIVDFLLIVVFYLLSKVFVLFPYNRKSKELQKTKDEMINKETYVSDIEKHDLENKELIYSLKNENNILSLVLIDNFKKKSVFILLDALDNIVIAFDKTKKILKENCKTGDNIKAASDNNPAIISLIEKSKKNPNKKTECSIDDIQLVSTIISSSNMNSAIMIVSKKTLI
jgi:hypothetical protein